MDEGVRIIHDFVEEPDNENPSQWKVGDRVIIPDKDQARSARDSLLSSPPYFVLGVEGILAYLVSRKQFLAFDPNARPDIEKIDLLHVGFNVFPIPYSYLKHYSKPKPAPKSPKNVRDRERFAGTEANLNMFAPGDGVVIDDINLRRSIVEALQSVQPFLVVQVEEDGAKLIAYADRDAWERALNVPGSQYRGPPFVWVPIEKLHLWEAPKK